jgi:GTP 3',8-cyclase
MLDKCGREIDYLRISVTPNCNLQCIYCNSDMPEAAKTISKRYLTASEIGLVTAAMANLGIKKVRITGGEPLMRPDLAEIISNVVKVNGISDISMTTNGIGLAETAKNLKDAGLKRVNVSIDSLDNDKYAYITGGGDLAQVLKGIKSAVDAGLSPIKINVVTIKGINDDEINEFIGLAKAHPVDVRFIELMPIGQFGADNSDRIVFNSDIIAAHPWLQELENNSAQVAQYYAGGGYCGRVGFISPISHKFCDHCNRIRVTYDGKIKPCLGDNSEIDISAVLRRAPEQLEGFIKKAILKKPFGHHFGGGFVSKRSMLAIGG